MTDRDQLLPNPFAELPPPPIDQELADIVAAIERELQAFIERPPLFLADEFAERNLESSC